MKNLLNISALLCAVALATSCSNEEIVENGTAVDGFTLVATTGADTRTTVDDDYKVTWTTGDAFYAFGNNTKGKTYSSRGKFTLKGEGGATGTFKGTVIGSMSALQYAVYPADNYDSGTMTLSFPNEYTYPVSNAPMFGKVSANEGKVEFKQLLCGMMRVTLNGLEEEAEGSLTLTSSSTNITGSAPLTIDANGKATLSSLSNNKGQKITLSFKNEGSTGSLMLDIPLPAATYGNDLTATLKIGSAETVAFTTEAGFEIIAGEIKEMTELTISEVTSSTISFTKKVGDAAGANKELEAGAKNVTVAEMGSNSELEIPNTSKADDPVTINVSSATTDNFTVKGVQGGTTEAIKINLPTGSKGTVTVENIKSVEITGGWDQTSSGTVSDPLVIKATAGAGVEELTVKEIEHVEVSGAWKKVTASTGENTFVVKADAVIEELIVNDGNIEIEEGGEVKKLTLNNDVTINKSFDVLTGKSMEIDLGTYTLTLPSRPEGIMNYVRIFKNANLTIKGNASEKGTVNDATKGISAYEDGATFTMENVDYVAANTNGYGVFLQDYVSSATINIKNSTMTGKYYCVGTNANTPVGSGNTISLESSTFTANETALLVNTPTKVTATGCTFTGGWQGAFLRSGETTFDACSINLNVKKDYEACPIAAGATSWSNGNKAPSAALTAGNKGSDAYDRTTTVHFKTSCSFSVTTDDTNSYPTIYIDADTGKPNQGVILNYDGNCKTAIEAKGVLDIRNKEGKVTVNGTAYSGAD